jgi:hypothetical protein
VVLHAERADSISVYLAIFTDQTGLAQRSPATYIFLKRFHSSLSPVSYHPTKNPKEPKNVAPLPLPLPFLSKLGTAACTYAFLEFATSRIYVSTPMNIDTLYTVLAISAVDAAS